MNAIVKIICVGVMMIHAGVSHAGLIISEYVEGSSYNKAIEIFNTGGTVDFGLGDYNLEIYTNGSETPSRVIDLTGIIASQSTYVVTHSRSDNVSLLPLANLTTGSLNFNGDDAIALKKGMAIIDSFGEIGLDPGSGWGNGSLLTKDHTLRRMVDITIGDVVTDDSFDPAMQWIGVSINDFSGLGQHTVSMPDPVSMPNAQVPEPRGWIMMATGLFVMLLVRRRRGGSNRQRYEQMIG